MIEAPGADVFRSPSLYHRDLGFGQCWLQFDNDGTRNLVLKIDRVTALCIKLSRPEHATARCVRQFD